MPQVFSASSATKMAIKSTHHNTNNSGFYLTLGEDAPILSQGLTSIDLCKSKRSTTPYSRPQSLSIARENFQPFKHCEYIVLRRLNATEVKCQPLLLQS
jgi:hypothetical protein